MRNACKSVTQLGRLIAHAKSKILRLAASTESGLLVQSIMHINRQSLTDTLINMILDFNEDSSNDTLRWWLQKIVAVSNIRLEVITHYGVIRFGARREYR